MMTQTLQAVMNHGGARRKLLLLLGILLQLIPLLYVRWSLSIRFDALTNADEKSEPTTTSIGTEYRQPCKI